MRGYRLYLFDGDRRRGERMARAIVLAAETEAEALAEAKQHRGRRYAELWHLDHLVKVLNPD